MSKRSVRASEQDGRHADGEVGPGAAGPARVDEQGADAVVLAAGRGAGEAEREGVACRVVVVDRDLEGAAVALPQSSRDRVLAAAAGLVGVGRHARQVIVGRARSPRLPAHGPRRGRAGRSGCRRGSGGGGAPADGIRVDSRCRRAQPSLSARSASIHSRAVISDSWIAAATSRRRSAGARARTRSRSARAPSG